MKNKFLLLFISIFFFPLLVCATHIVGGSLTYEQLSGSTYRVTLKLYRDCKAGSAAFPGTVAIEVRRNNGTALPDISIPFTSSSVVPPNIDTCATNPGICLEEAIYAKVVSGLPPSTGGYHLYFQYCCRNSTLQNVVNPLTSGETWYAHIPDNGIVISNSSPKWVKPPPVFVCQGRNMSVNHSATDADGDSLVYSLYTPYDSNAVTFPAGVFTPIKWTSTYGANNPLNAAVPNSLTISPTGVINGIPPNLGQFVAGVRCREYRNGVLIGEILRDFQFNVVNCPPVANPGFNFAGACTGNTVAFTNTTSPAANTYFWNFGESPTLADTSHLTNPSYTYGSKGSYTVMLIINKGTPCADTSIQIVNVSFVNANFTNTAPACQGFPVNFTDASTFAPGTSISTWNWIFGDGPTTSALKNPSHIYNSGGTFNVRLIITTAAGCKDTAIFPVTIQSQPIANAGNDTVRCSNSSTIGLGGTVLNATGGKWIGTGGFSPNNTTLNPTYTPTPTAIANGKDTVLFYTTGNGLCPADTDQVIITFTSGPTVNTGGDIFVCKDTVSVPICVTITVATGGTWQTTGSGTFVSPTSSCTSYIPSTADTTAGSVIVYVVSTGNGNCAASRDSTKITFTATPTTTITSNDSACSGGSIPFSVLTSTGSGIWTSNGGGSFSPSSSSLNGTYTPTAAETTAGTVRLVFKSTNNGGCRSDSDTIDVTITPKPTVNAGANIFVCQDTSSVPICATVNGAVGGVWQTMGTGTFVNANQTCTSYLPSTADTAAGSVIVYIATTGNGVCSAAHDSTLITFTSPTYAVITSNDTACAGHPIGLSVNVSTGSGVWSTSGTGTFLPNNTTVNGVYMPSSADDAAGTVKLYFVSTNNGGCRSSKDTITITLIAAPTAAYTSTNACPGFPIVFTDGSTSIGPIVNWNWNFGDNGTSSLQNPTHIYASGGPHTVRLIVTSTNGCVDTVTQLFNVFDKPAANFNANGICLRDGTLFLDSTIVTGTTIASWNWTFGDNTTGNTQNPLHYYLSSGNYFVTLIVQSAQGCIDTVAKTLTLLQGPKAKFIIDDYTAYVNQTVKFTDQSTNFPVSWFWDFGDTSPDSTSTLQNPTHIYRVGGVYYACLIVTDANGCKDTTCQKEIVSLPPVVPSGFTPNHDGENDIFYVYGGPFKKLNVKIYNNWGELIFESNSQSHGWDGKRNGVDQAIGVYVWTVVGDTEDDQHYELSGDVTLIR
jgi:gliding motility-associated-like protein